MLLFFFLDVDVHSWHLPREFHESSFSDRNVDVVVRRVDLNCFQ